MSETVIFTLTPKDKKGGIIFKAPNGKTYSSPSIAGAMREIAHDYPLEQKIAFQWHDTKQPSFADATVEQWLTSTRAIRGLKAHEAQAELEGYRNLHAASWA